MKKYSDVLIVGSGIAGLSLAIKTAQLRPDLQITIVAKTKKSETNTKYAQGGIAAVLSTEDSFENHIEDTLKAGDYLGNRDIIEKIVREAPDRIQEIVDWGASFDKNNKGDYILGMEGGHSNHRIVHHKDITGLEIQNTLLRKVEDFENITILQHHFVIDLITNRHLKIINPVNNCYGAYVLNQQTKEVETYIASKICLASGGIGQVYKHTTNPSIATGDGVSMAYRAKAMITGMEFIQFHPTALYELGKTPCFLITEAVRGAGAVLKNDKGERFMSKYDSRMELASRDIVSRAIDYELKQSGSSYVYLDATAIKKEEFKKHFPNIEQKCKSIGIDVSKDMIPVVPAMHYLCGGISVDIDGKTSVGNLYACGECADTGLHGANRLASNSLLEALVFSHSLSADITSNFARHNMEVPEWNEKGITMPKEKILIKHNKEEIQSLMSNYVAIVRSDDRLQKALNRLDIIHRETEEFYQKSKISTSLGELRNLITTAYIIVSQSIKRKENKGTFYNQDLASNENIY